MAPIAPSRLAIICSEQFQSLVNAGGGACMGKEKALPNLANASRMWKSLAKKLRRILYSGLNI